MLNDECIEKQTSRIYREKCLEYKCGTIFLVRNILAMHAMPLQYWDIYLKMNFARELFI